jgi:hypothetical protein
MCGDEPNSKATVAVFMRQCSGLELYLRIRTVPAPSLCVPQYPHRHCAPSLCVCLVCVCVCVGGWVRGGWAGGWVGVDASTIHCTTCKPVKPVVCACVRTCSQANITSGRTCNAASSSLLTGATSMHGHRSGGTIDGQTRSFTARTCRSNLLASTNRFTEGKRSRVRV